MLKNISPLLHPDLLATLRAMGHGDDIVVADANFPADVEWHATPRWAGCCAWTVQTSRKRCARFCRSFRWTPL